MTLQDARKLLDSIKEGASYHEDVVNKALDKTGDQPDFTYQPAVEIDEFVQSLRESGSL